MPITSQPANYQRPTNYDDNEVEACCCTGCNICEWTTEVTKFFCIDIPLCIWELTGWVFCCYCCCLCRPRRRKRKRRENYNNNDCYDDYEYYDDYESSCLICCEGDGGSDDGGCIGDDCCFGDGGSSDDCCF